MKIFAWFGFIVLVLASGAMAGAFAYDLGASHGPEWAAVFAAGAAALLVIECALAGGRGMGNPWLRWPALVLVGLSVCGLELGFAAAVTSDARAHRAAAANVAAKADQLGRAVDAPAAVLRVKLEGIEAHNKGVGASWCRSRHQSNRDACGEWLGVRADLAQAEAAETATGKAETTTGDPDARAALLTRILGGVESAWSDKLVLLLALAMTFARVAAASMLLAPTESLQAVKAAPVAAEPRGVAAPAGENAESLRVVDLVGSAHGLTEPAQKVLRVVKSHAEAAGIGQSFIGFVPPGRLGQRAIVEQSGLGSRRQVTDALHDLQSAGLIEVRDMGKGRPAEIVILKD